MNKGIATRKSQRLHAHASIQNYKGQILTQGGWGGGGERWMGWGRYSHCVLRQGTDSINPGL